MRCHLLIFFAQVPSPTTAEFLGVVGTLMLLATAISTYYTILANRRRALEPSEPQRRILPQPLSVRQEDEPVLHREFASFCKEVEKEFRRIEDDAKDRREETREQFSTVYEKMDEQSRSLNQTIQNMSKDLHRAVGVLEGKTNSKSHQ
jgi:hypothetical protein